MNKKIKETLRKLLITASLGGFLTGCTTLGQNPNTTGKSAPSGTLSAEQIPLEDINTYFNTERDIRNDNPENYKKDMMFVYRKAQQQNKKFFEFDGTTYRTDDTPLAQIDALLKARQKGEISYIFNGKKKEACSYYPADSQIKIFGNLWEELRSPQTQESKKIIREVVNAYALPAFRDIVLDRTYKVLRLSGYPEIKSEASNQSLMGKLIEACYNKKTSHYEPSTLGSGVIYLAPRREIQKGTYFHPDDFFAELAHAFRDNNNFFGETSQFFGDAFKDIITLNTAGFGKKAHDKNYKNKNRMEYDAHKVVEPAIKNYIIGLIPTIPALYSEIEKVREANKNTYLLTPSASKKAAKGKKESDGIAVTLFGYNRTLKDK